VLPERPDNQMDEHEDYRDEFKDRVLAEFRRIRQDVLDVGSKLDAVRNNDITMLKVEIAVLKTKAALIGAVSGLVVSTIIGLIMRYAGK
jgi:hypothetical protein